MSDQLIADAGKQAASDSTGILAVMMAFLVPCATPTQIIIVPIITSHLQANLMFTDQSSQHSVQYHARSHEMFSRRESAAFVFPRRGSTVDSHGNHATVSHCPFISLFIFCFVLHKSSYTVWQVHTSAHALSLLAGGARSRRATPRRAIHPAAPVHRACPAPL